MLAAMLLLRVVRVCSCCGVSSRWAAMEDQALQQQQQQQQQHQQQQHQQQ
jgi:hypothetical protein